MGGHQHDFLRSTVHTQLADSYLATQGPSMKQPPRVPPTAKASPAKASPAKASQGRLVAIAQHLPSLGLSRVDRQKEAADKETDAPAPQSKEGSKGWSEASLSHVSLVSLERAHDHLTRGLKVLDAVSKQPIKDEAAAGSEGATRARRGDSVDQEDGCLSDGSADDDDEEEEEEEGNGYLACF